MNKRMPLVVDWLRDLATRARTPVPHPFDDLEAVLELSKARLWSTVDAHLGKFRCMPAPHEAEIRRVERLLPQRVLPVEHNDRPIDLRAIIAGGWLAVAEPAALDPEALVRATEDAPRQRFLAKAMELSAVKRGWGDLGLPEQ